MSQTLLLWGVFNTSSAQSVAPESRSPRAPFPEINSAELSEEPIQLSPFLVSAESEVGYQATNTLAGTRISTSVKDVGASISIYTKEFLADLGVNNTNDLLIYATGMEAAGPQGNYSGTGNNSGESATTGDSVRTNPLGGSRTRGLSGPNYTRNFFSTSIRTDSYNSGAVTVNRGPNAILFGVGEAAGVVDTAINQAELRRNSNKVELRVGDNNSLRSSVDFNRVLVKNKLALRVAALNDEERYDQQPAFQHQQRIYGALTFKPFTSSTLRFGSEHGTSNANRPISVLPFNSISDQWIEAGSPGYDWRFYDDPAVNPLAATQQSSSFAPLTMGQNQIFDQVVFVFSQPNASAPDFAFRGTTPGGNAANQYRTGVFDAAINRDLRSDNINFVSTRNAGELPAGAYAGGKIPAGRKMQGYTDFAVFDFKNRIIDETSRQTDKFRSLNVAFEQLAWGDKLGLEIAYNMEKVEGENRNSYFQASNNNHVRIDTSASLPNGQPNPNYGRPFAQYGGGNWSDPETGREAIRATGFVRYDFRDLGPKWTKWLGRHSLTALYEESSIESLRNNSRLAVFGPAADAINASATAFGRRPALITYIGPSVFDSGGKVVLSSIKSPFIRDGLTADTSFYSSPASTTQQGSFVTVPTTLRAIGETASYSRDFVESQAAVLQSYWLDEHVVTTVGWRKDDASRDTINVPYNPVVSDKIYYSLDDFDLPKDSLTPQVSKDTLSYSGVLRWPQKWVRLPLGMDASVFGNKSENFTPSGGRTNVFNEGLGSPEGKTEEIGLNLSFLDDRLFLRVNHFKTAVVGASISANGPYSTAYNNGVQQMAGFWATERNINPAIDRSADIELLWSALPSNFRDQIGWRVIGNAADATLSTTVPTFPQTVSDTTDYQAEGWEYEITFNPTRQWRVLFNLSQQETVQTNIAPQAKDFIARMLPIWEQLGSKPRNNYPPGWVLGDPLPATTQTVREWLNSPVGPLPLYADLVASEGVASAEQRKWRANLVLNYTFANEGRLMGWNIGAGIRWQDKIGLGYPATTSASGGTLLDIDNPYYGPAETNVDAFIGYKRKIFKDRYEWRAQLNVRNIYASTGDLIDVRVQPDGSTAVSRLAPEKRIYLTNTLSF